VASIEDQLARQDWEPMPGDTLVGTITGIKIRVSKGKEGKKGVPYPVLLIRQDGKDGREYIVPQAALVATDIIAHGPAVGERAGIRFDGPKEARDGETYDRYTIAWEKEDDAAPDWGAIREARGMPVTSGTAPRSEPGDEPPLPDEPPF
jgi:hypothetical protein